MDGPGQLAQGDQGILPPGDQQSTVLDQPLVPEHQLARISAALPQVAEESVALADHLVVARQVTTINRVDLAQHDVQVAAPPSRGARDQGDVVGQKEDDHQLAQQVHAPPRHAVQPDLLPVARPVVRLAGEGDLDADLILAPCHTPHKAGIGQRFPFDSQPVDQLAVGPGVGRTAGRQIVDRLQEVCLALGVVADQHCDPRLEVQVQPDVIAYVVQREMGQAHAAIIAYLCNCAKQQAVRLP